jgi:hypothetical protein
MTRHTHPSVDELREALREHDAELACTICHNQDFAISYAAPLDVGSHQYYGNQRLERTQVTCLHCGHVMSFDLDALRSPVGKGEREASPAAQPAGSNPLHGRSSP